MLVCVAPGRGSWGGRTGSVLFQWSTDRWVGMLRCALQLSFNPCFDKQFTTSWIIIYLPIAYFFPFRDLQYNYCRATYYDRSEADIILFANILVGEPARPDRNAFQTLISQEPLERNGWKFNQIIGPILNCGLSKPRRVWSAQPF